VSHGIQIESGSLYPKGSKRVQKGLKGSKRVQKGPKESNRIQKGSKGFLKEPKGTKKATKPLKQLHHIHGTVVILVSNTGVAKSTGTTLEAILEVRG